MNALASPRTRLLQWLADSALPLWSDAGRDRRHGGFHECLEYSGRAASGVPKRLRVQARQIYVMSHAHVLGLPHTLDAAEAGFAFMTRHGWAEEGGFVHLLTPAGGCLDAKRDTYDHAFVLLALAWYLKATGSGEARRWIERTLAFLEGALWEPDTGTYREAVPPELPRRQNPHMHLLEAFMALFETTGEQRFLDLAGNMVSLLRSRFFDPATRTLAEFFDDRWQMASGLPGRLREPGHHYEWVFLLSQFERLSGETVEPYRTALYGFAQAHGAESATGMVYDTVTCDGQVHDATKRCWVQTEALRAMLVSDDQTGAARVAENLLTRYLATEMPGLWVDQFGRNDEKLTKAVPASTLYHLMGACVALGAALPTSSRA